MHCGGMLQMRTAVKHGLNALHSSIESGLIVLRKHAALRRSAE